MSTSYTGKTFERGTPAGNALFRLYGGKKKMDSTLDPELLKRLQAMRKVKEAEEADRVKPKVVPKSRAHVAVPRPVRSASAAPVVLPRPGRKPLQAIETERAQEAPVPKPVARRAVTDDDKLRLQHIMEFGRDIRADPPPVRHHVSVRDPLRERFQEIRQEVKERQSFLKDIKEYGAQMPSCKTEADRVALERQLFSEIDSRIKEMKELDLRMRDTEPDD